MKLGISTMLPLSRSPIRLAFIAAFVLSGIVTHVNPIVAGDEVFSDMNAPVVEKHAAGHHHHVTGQKFHNEKMDRHGHINAVKKKVDEHLDTIKLHSNNHGRHHNHPGRHHHRQRPGNHHRKHHHHLKQGVHRRKKGPHGHKKHHRGKHKHKHCDKDKECVRDEVDASKPRIASFGVLICENKTISAVYCPTGTLTRPGAELRTLVQLYAANIPDALAAMNNNMSKPITFVNSTYSKTLAYYDIIEMQAPCPKPAYADITAALKQLTCSDRKLLSVLFNMHHYGTEKMMAIELRNTGGHNNCSSNFWADKCTSTGTFCGIDLFGCNTIDDGLYHCATIGQKPSLLEICPLGGCVPLPSSSGPSHCRHGDCECAGTGQICGSEFPPSCKFDDSSLYFCTGSNSTPVALHECPTGECPRGAIECPTPPIDDTCICKGPGSICGATFHTSCKLEMGSLYICSDKGAIPAVETRCESLSCPSGQTACDPISYKDCDCQKPGKICGSSFPSECNLDAGSLYSCNNKGDKPLRGERCPSNSCPKGADKCDATPYACKCKAAGYICSTSLPDACNLEMASIYSCPGPDALPVFKEKCDSGLCKSGGTECEETPIPPEKCLCQTTGKICGSTFPAACKYDSASLYYCAKKGGKPTLTEKCASNSCKSGNTACDPVTPPNPDECKCKGIGKICGASFPRTCGFASASLFDCTGKDAKPTLVERCESNSCPAGNTKCDPLVIDTECYCKTVGEVCGSSFPAKCGYNSGSLYTCAQIDFPPASSVRCKSNSCKRGNSACDPLAPPDPDECKCKGVGKYCGADFPEVCNFYSGSLFTCAQKGLNPAFSEKCPSNSCPKGASACDPIEHDPCLCPAKGPICSSKFPDKCNLDKGVMYICSDSGDTPKFVEKCISGTCKASGDACKEPGPCICEDEDVGKTICGASFVETCKLDAGTLYKCDKKGEKPKVVEKCKSNSCKAGNDRCDTSPLPEECLCKGDKKICGSSFLAYCGWDSASLYDCRGIDDTPSLVETCTSNSCSKGNSECDPEEQVDNCKCQAPSLLCGTNFPATCSLHAAYLYLCEARGDIPKVVKKCQSNSCPKNNGECDPSNYSQDCKCTKAEKICGSSFPLFCAIDAGSLFECSGPEATPSLVRKCLSNNCVRGDSKCEPISDLIPCECFGEGEICGSTFPGRCKLDAASLYTCEGKGLTPKSPKECESNSCPSGGSKCDDENPIEDCKCKATGTICSDTFPPSCGLVPKSLYDCVPRMDPELLYTCKSGSCNAGSVACEVNECQCTAEQDLVCGSFFPAKCILDPAALYVCSGNWTDPYLDQTCASGSCPPDASKCDPGPCDCAVAGYICGATFPEACDLSASALYKCEDVGAQPQLSRECSSKECLKDQTKCTAGECACKKAGDICGSDFPEKCGYDAGTLFSCEVKDEDPTVNIICGSGSCPKGTGECEAGDCSCKAVGNICGASFPAFCRLNDFTLYTCDKVGGTPVAKDICLSHVCNKDDTKCGESPCACGENKRVCGSEFPSDCGYAAAGIYDCGNVGTTPIFDHMCSAGVCNKDKHHCEPDTCDCPRVGAICGSTFPASCGYAAAGLYQCDEIGERPQSNKVCKSKACEPGAAVCGEDPCVCKVPGILCGKTYPEVCGFQDDYLYSCLALRNQTIPKPVETCIEGCDFGADKCRPTDPCLCTIDGPQCGSYFPDSCNYNKDVLYNCKFMKKPEYYRDCVAGTCPPEGYSCNAIDECLCKEVGMICGSSFPSQCMANKHALYKCNEVGKLPVFELKCPSASCPVGSDACSDLKFCSCEKHGDVCGSTFDESCGFAQGTLYSCEAANAEPKEKEVCDSKLCKSGEDKCSNIDKCACTRTGQICGSAFVESCPIVQNALYFCADEGDAPKYIDSCYTKECLADADQCTPDPCLCTAPGSTCGANFPERCKYEADGIYYCVTKDVGPIFAQNCDTGACPAGQKICTPKPEECTCFKPGQLCGSTFPASCNLNKDTMYFCGGKGETPMELEMCKPGSCKYGAENCERILECYCKGPGSPCGKDFPKECRLEADAQFQCSNAGDLPIPIKAFPPGECSPDKDPFKQDPCACSGTGTVCGHVFDLPSCPAAAFEDDSIYSCVNNREPVKIRECTLPDQCTQMGATASCKADPCSCDKEGQKVCGFGIDSSCGTYEKDASYVCSGGKLIKDMDCPKGCLAYEGVCKDNCVCEKDGLVCGSVFTGCPLDPNTLYKCQTGKRPTKVRDCHPSSCKVNSITTESVNAFTAGQYADTCDINPCFCDADDTLVCGDKVNPVCKFDPTALISCPGDGGKPIIVKNCDPNKCITKDGSTRCDTSSDPCLCPSDGTFCGVYFPEECRLPPETVYSCTGVNKLPINIVSCFPQQCNQVANEGFCETDPCVCSQNNATVCSGDFPKVCSFQANTVMTCNRFGRRPMDLEVCTPDNCITVDGSARCDKDPCLCSETKEKICGNSFPDKCELVKEAIYECKAPMTKPVRVSNCDSKEMCDDEGPEAVCKTNPCFCYTENIGEKVCGSEFPSHCYYDNKVIYSCVTDHTEWTVSRPCGPDDLCLPATSDTEEPTCSQDGCLCQAEDVGKDFCGVNFPNRCYFLDEAIVTCEKEGERPVPKEMCSPNKCIFNAKEGTANCKNNECTCKAGQKTACGSYWPAECLYEASMIYQCDGVDGTLPQRVNSCNPARCVFDGDKAKCKSTPCQCNEEDITLCGTDFVKDCGYDDNTIYTCSGEGSTPVFDEKCPNQCVHSMVTNTSRCIGGACDCPRIGAPKNFCGALFPKECKYDNNTVYHCEASGEKPTKLENCTDSGKECALTGDKAQSCVDRSCECREGFPRQCGADFLPSCNFDPKIVFSCKDPTTPVPEVTCDEDCNPSPTPHCEENVCACKEGVTLMCSSEFPATCGYDKDAVYRCLDPKNPIKHQDCAPNKCVSTPEPHCFVDPCACKASQNLVCGSDFPSECKLKTNAVYKCQGLKTPALSEECNPGVCVTMNDTAACRNEACYCKDGVKTTCSDTFPAVCGYSNDPAQIFRCSGAGSKPSPSIKCNTQCIPNIPNVSVQCKPDPCECIVELVSKKLCASQFLPSCGLSVEKLYYCGALGSLPTEVGDCKAPSVCEVKDDVGTCKPPTDPCMCPVDEAQTTICGSQFETRCGYKPDSVYDCKDKAGRKPVEVTSCSPQACVPGKNSATCAKDPCRCTAAKVPICGGSFPTKCGYDSGALYFCDDVGSIPGEFTKCAGGCNPTASACKTDPCACTSSSSACGSAFPDECALSPNTLYSCDRAGALPKMIEVCTAGCTKGATTCNVDPCVCTKAELKCGSAFDPTCRLNNDILYECAGKSAKPSVKETCIPSGCLSGTTACVKDPCKCGTAPSTCGGAFDASCKFDKDRIYQCADEGATPTPGELCGAGLCGSATKTSVAVCLPDCTCKSNKDTCGIDFPAACKFPKDTLYTCSKIGATPVQKEICNLNGCKTGTNKCYVDPCACKAIGDICGKDICTTLKPDTIYLCNALNGPALPKPSTADCGAGKCNGGRCGDDTCLCTEDGPFCGNELPCPGLNPDLYYSCGIGYKPFPFNRCKNGEPTTGMCLCNDGNSMCSTYFPFECGYEQNQIFDCPTGAGGKPVTHQQCGVGRCTSEIKCDEDCKCKDSNSKCGKNFDPKCNYAPGSIYTCSGKGATPVEGKACGGADLCDSVSGVGRCFGECKCKTYEPVCGAAFPASCGFKPGTLYQCDFGGADPVRPKSCLIPCNPQHGPDKCGQSFS